MAKADLLRRTDQQPAATAGRFQTTSVTTVTSLTMAGPYYGDFQIAGGGRLIVGEGTDTGARVVANNGGLYGYDQYGAQTFALYTNSSGTHTPGDLFAGSTLSNYLQYDASAGTFGLYNTAGAGFIATANGDLQAGLATGAHMRWNATSEALEVRWGDEVRISLDAAGNAMFTGEVNATGGTITGDMAVSGRLQVGEVDGPQVNIGVALDEGTNEYFSEIVATNAENVPWFHVRAGGPYPYGYLTIGAPGDYPHQLTYNGDVLKMDGDIYARTGYFYDVIQMQQSAQTAVRGLRALGDTTGGEIRQGTGTPGVDFTGLRMGYVNDGDGVWQLAGYSSDVKQAYFGADGKIYAGAGDVTIDASGIYIATGNAAKNQVYWVSGGDTIGTLYTDVQTTTPTTYIKTSSEGLANSQVSYVELSAQGTTAAGAATNQAGIFITSPINTGYGAVNVQDINGAVATFSEGGIVFNELGAAATDFRLETNTEENMIFSDASEDLLYLGGTTNGIKIAKGGALTLLGTASITATVTHPVRVETATYAVAAGDEIIIANKATAMSVTLPAATGTGRLLTVKSIGAGAVTVDPNDSETIDGSTTQVLGQWDGITIVDYAAGVWVII